MTSPIMVTLKPGAVVRTRDLANLSDNPSRLAKRLLMEGRLKRLNLGGLFYVPRRTRFGMVGPDMLAVLEVFLNGGPFVETGPPVWNTLGLGGTRHYSFTLFYNTKRSGIFTFANSPVYLKRVAFPQPPTLEWFVVDFLENLESVGLTRGQVAPKLVQAIQEGRFDKACLTREASTYGTAATRRFLECLLGEAP